MAECDFSLAHYRDILAQAQVAVYRLATCLEYARQPSGTEQLLVLRHDIDYSIDPAMRLAEVESQFGIRSTFFIRTDSELYKLALAENRRRLRSLASEGFELGLHYTLTPGREWPEHRQTLAAAKARLEDALGVEILGASEHRPTARGRDLATANDAFSQDQLAELGVEYEAYAPAFTRDLCYVSDSAHRWRQGCIHTHLRREPRLYLLVHPVWWIEPPSCWDAILEALRAGR